MIPAIASATGNIRTKQIVEIRPLSTDALTNGDADIQNSQCEKTGDWKLLCIRFTDLWALR